MTALKTFLEKRKMVYLSTQLDHNSQRVQVTDPLKIFYLDFLNKNTEAQSGYCTPVKRILFLVLCFLMH